MKLLTTLKFNNEIFLLDFVRDYYPEIVDFTKIVNLELSEKNLLTFEYDGNIYELPLLLKQDFLKVLNFFGAIRYTDDNLNMYFKTKSGKVFTIPLEDFQFIRGENVEKVRKLIDNN